MKIQEFDYSVDLLQSLLWQYNDATHLQALITKKQEWYTAHQTAFWQEWYTNVFDLRTANFFGLAVWSYILNIPLFVPINPENPDKPVFGFNEEPSINNYQNFENGNFAVQDGIIILTLDEQRLILRLRYYQLVSRGAIPEINTLLNTLFKVFDMDDERGAWILDGFDMSIVYVFNFVVSTSLRTVLTEYDLLPRPAGVGIRYIITDDLPFGFGDFNENFERGNFVSETPF